MAKVIGDAAKEIPKKGNVVSGLLIKQSFNYHIVAPSELTEHTDLKTSTVTQRQVIAFPYTFAFLRHFMLLMHGEAVSFNTEKIEDERKEVIFIMEKVKIIHDGVNNSVTLEWKATAENDMWADSVLATILQIDNSPEVIRISQSACQHDHKHGHDHKHDVDEEEGKDEDEDKKPNISDPEEGLLSSVERLSGTTFANQLCKHLTRLFGMCTMNDDGTVLVVNVDSISAEVTLRMTTFTVHSTDNLLKESVKKAARRFWFTTKSTADLPQPKQQR